MSTDERQALLFFREFNGLTGGHLKVRDYFRHVFESRRFRPLIAFSEGSTLAGENPWASMPEVRTRWAPEEASALFLGGTDWEQYPESLEASLGLPVINLIQHVRHADAEDPLHRYLARPAVRICVSEEVEQAILKTGCVRGPVFSIPNGLDLAELPAIQANKIPLLLILCPKQPELGQKIQLALDDIGIASRLERSFLPRAEYLRLINLHRWVLNLPNPTEGFFLPALETMALRSLSICPDCVGNHGFCLPGSNGYRPPYTIPAIVDACASAVGLGVMTEAPMLAAAEAVVREHRIELERQRFLEILDRLDALWGEI